MSATRATLIRDASALLDAAGVADAGREARLLMRWAGGHDGALLAAVLGQAPSAREATRFADGTERRAARQPLSHITGQRQFWNRAFRVTADVLDPRPETECLVAEALHRGPFRRVLDIGIGSGCILLTLLAEWPEAMGVGTDSSAAALAVARANAVDLGVTDRADLALTDWTDGVAAPFDLVVTNPPYIDEAEMATLEPEVRLHEPAAALSPGGDGLDAYRAIAPRLPDLLAPGGLALVEIGPTQYDTVAALIAGAGLNVLMVIPDLDQRPRVVLAQG